MTVKLSVEQTLVIWVVVVVLMVSEVMVWALSSTPESLSARLSTGCGRDTFAELDKSVKWSI